MKDVYVICGPDDYFARDALMGEIEHRGKQVAFSESSKAADGIILIIGANTKVIDALKNDIDSMRKNNKPILTIFSHPQNDQMAEFSALSPVKWEWQTINEFIDNL